MPGIPVYQRKMSIPSEGPNVLQDVGSAGLVGNAVAQFGKIGMNAADNLGDVLWRRDQELKNQTNTNLAVQKGAEADNDWLDTSIAIKNQYQGNDASAVMDLTKEYFKAAKERFAVPDNEKVNAHVQGHLLARENQALSGMASYQAGQIQVAATNVRNYTLETSMKEAQLTPENVGTAIATYQKAIDSQLANGSISAEEYAIHKRDGVSKIREANIESVLATDPVSAQTIFNAVKNDLKTDTQERLGKQLDVVVKKKLQEEKEMTAYATASEAWPDAKKAMVEVLKPEFMKKHGLTINEAQNIAQSFSAIGAQREREAKDLQEKNLDAVRSIAITNPVKALRDVKTAQDVDPKDALALQNSLESHLRQMSLMSAQEKSLRLDLEDKIKAKIKVNIMAGAYKSEKDVTNAVISEGLSNTSGFLDDALGNFRSFKKDGGSINYFQQATDDWDRLISTTKGTARKRELQDMKPKMLETLRLQMERDGLRVSDPKVFEDYQTNRKALTQTTFQKAIDSVGSFFGGSGDSFVAPKAVATPTPPASPIMDEATARKRLSGMKITGAAQDKQIKDYRDAGVIK